MPRNAPTSAWSYVTYSDKYNENVFHSSTQDAGILCRSMFEDVVSTLRAKSDHKRFVHFLTCCGTFPIWPERSAAKSKATRPTPSLLFDLAAGAATLRANGLCVLKECHTVPMSCGSI